MMKNNMIHPTKAELIAELQVAQNWVFKLEDTITQKDAGLNQKHKMIALQTRQLMENTVMDVYSPDVAWKQSIEF